MEDKKVELLAPAGNPEAFYGAIHAGADAVYLAGEQFGARAYADNFTTEELVSCIRYAHILGRKVYLTVNTLVKESELAQVPDYLRPFYEAGLDGVIVQDIGVLAVIRENFPGLELHASTQMTVTGEYGSALLKELGVCRIVPARELGLAEIRAIKEATGLELETFIHGAMCYSYSGQCLFSSILGGRSGNRGRCAGPCRLPYKVTCRGETTKECFPLSLKDMCTIEHIPELIAAGIDSFKIEGRMKKPEYAAGVTAIYRKYIDKYYSSGHKEAFRIEPKDLQALSNLYIRSERQDGYYYKTNGADMVSLHNPGYSGSDEALLAQVRARYLEQKPSLPISIYGVFLTGERATLTMTCGEYTVCQEGDEVSVAKNQPITRENVRKQLGKLGDTSFWAEDMEITLSEDAFYPLKAINELRRSAVRALEDEIIAGQGLCVKRESLPVKQMGVKQINVKQFEGVQGDAAGKEHGFSVSVRTREQLSALISWMQEHSLKQAKKPISTVFLSEFPAENLFEGNQVNQKELSVLCQELQKLSEGAEEIVLSLPYIVRRKDYISLRRLLKILPSAEQQSEQNSAEVLPIQGIQVRSLEGLGFLKAEKYSGKIYGDAGFYHWNRKTISEWASSLSGFCLPYELKSAEQRALIDEKVGLVGNPGNTRIYKVVYGRLPMMLTANCVAKTTVGCQKAIGDGYATLTDRYRKNFPVVLDCAHCMNIIYNSVPLSLHGEVGKWYGRVGMRLDFTTEDAVELKEVLHFFATLGIGNAGVPPYKDYTTGHEKRGVE